MITESTIYWITRMEKIECFFFILTAVSCVYIIGYSIWYFADTMESCDKEERKKSISKTLTGIKYLLIPIILGLITVFIPTTKEMCAIKIIPVISQNEDVQEIPQQLLDLTKEWVEELKPNRKE